MKPIKAKNPPGNPDEWQRGEEADPASYDGPIGRSGDLTAAATWEYDRRTRRRVLVVWQ
jgi:hypothetical protein